MALAAGAPLSPPFSVWRRQPELIKPAKPTPHELKEVSDIDDQEGLRFQIPFIMFYGSIKGKKDPVRTIRKALSEALTLYYPFAGRLIESPNKKLMVDCNEEGILFIEADADTGIQQLGDSILPPCPSIEQLLYDVPGSSRILGCPLLLIQVTRLACGGFIFAVRLNHVMSDSVGLAKFLKATGEIAEGATTPSLLPVWERDILTARDPPRVTYVHHEYEDIKEDKNSALDDQPNMVHLSFFFGPTEMRSLRKLLSPRLSKCSTFELLAAFLWKIRTTALRPDPNETVRLSCIMNVNGNWKKGLKLPMGYYGNSFIFPTVCSRAESLCKNPLDYAVDLVRETKQKLSEEYVHSAIDLVVRKGRSHYARAWNFLAVDTSRVGLADVDFGWGKPVYGGPAGAFPYMSIFARYRNSKGEDGVVVPIKLPPLVMQRFQDQFLKMTQLSIDDNSPIPSML